MEINIIGKMNVFAAFIGMGWRFDSFLLNYKINFDGTKRASHIHGSLKNIFFNTIDRKHKLLHHLVTFSIAWEFFQSLDIVLGRQRYW